MNEQMIYRLGIDIGSTTVKIAVLNDNNDIIILDKYWLNTIESTINTIDDKYNIISTTSIFL